MVEIRNMSFGYKKKKLFFGLELSLQAGNIYGLLGKNGAGKTTLLKIIAGLRLAQEGSCRALGYDPALRPAPLLEELCFIAEELYLPALMPAVFERLHAPLYPRFDHEAFHTFLSEFELTTDKKLSEFSYGQKKKFLVAFGLASHCRLLLMDEPTNGLDIPPKASSAGFLPGPEGRTSASSFPRTRSATWRT